jgi:hypothetical protein
MNFGERKALFDNTLRMLKPALERVASDPVFRDRFELTPLHALDEMGVKLDADTRAELEGKRFSEFWAARRKVVEGPVEVRDLPPAGGELNDEELDSVAGGLGGTLAWSPLTRSLSAAYGDTPTFAPPYVPVGPIKGIK